VVRIVVENEGTLSTKTLDSVHSLRELVRYRRSIIEERARQCNRIQKVLEGANIKLGSVVSDIMGVSSKDILVPLETEKMILKYSQI
jgi:hypothetical protein